MPSNAPQRLSGPTRNSFPGASVDLSGLRDFAPQDAMTRRPDNFTARLGRSRLDPDPIDGHEEVRLPAQAARDICHLEQLLSDLVRRGQVRGHMV